MMHKPLRPFPFHCFKPLLKRGGCQGCDGECLCCSPFEHGRSMGSGQDTDVNGYLPYFVRFPSVGPNVFFQNCLSDSFLHEFKKRFLNLEFVELGIFFKNRLSNAGNIQVIFLSGFGGIKDFQYFLTFFLDDLLQLGIFVHFHWCLLLLSGFFYQLVDRCDDRLYFLLSNT